MQVFKTRRSLKPYLAGLKNPGNSIGFVPTMGALHQGHLSLIAKSKAENDVTVCSIFVNPTQFTDPIDLNKYPRPIENDIQLLEAAGCDILYLPAPDDIYPNGQENKSPFNFGGLENKLEGASRPGHFEGVAQVVEVFLTIVNPSVLYLGQKDYQQCIILTQLVSKMGLSTRVVKCPIMREENGLAMSSRNERLSPAARKNAGVIYQTLKDAAAHYPENNIDEIRLKAINKINATNGFAVDYFELLNASTLGKITSPQINDIVIVTAVLVEGIRLIDNLLINRSGTL